ncbi:MAG: hypothetical protein Q9160_007876 [Pyrenula sp. 1 TL-2023]
MKFQPTIWLAAIYIASSRLAHAWVLDEASCGPKDLGENPTSTNGRVRTALTSAFTMAGSAANELRGPDWENADVNKKNVFGYLFKDEGQFLRIRSQLIIRSPVKGHPSANCDRQGVLNRFNDEALSRERANIAGFLSDGNEVVIYCNMNRMQEIERDGRKYYYDTDVDERLEKTEDLRVCKETTDPLSSNQKIDTMALMDVTLIHEAGMTLPHWAMVTQMQNAATRKTQFTIGDANPSLTDSYAVFALAIRILNDPSKLIVQKDGSLAPKPNAPPKKRWVFPWTA